MNQVALALTKLWLRCLGNRFLRVSTIMLTGGIEQQVIVFSSKTFYMVGQVTPWGTILVHEFTFLSEKLRDISSKKPFFSVFFGKEESNLNRE